MAQYANQLSLYRKLKSFRGLGVDVAHKTGIEAMRHLWIKYLQGQKIKYKSKYDIRGRRTFRYSVKRKGDEIVISSYPLHLWERGFARRKTLASSRKGDFSGRRSQPTSRIKVAGKRIKGRYVLAQFAIDIQGQFLQQWTEKALTKKMEELFRQ